MSEIDLSKKVRYAKEVYGVEGILAVRCWNTGICFCAIVAKMSGTGTNSDWAAYVGALPNQRVLVRGFITEEEVVRYTCSYGGKMRAEEAAAMFKLPVKQYRR